MYKVEWAMQEKLLSETKLQELTAEKSELSDKLAETENKLYFHKVFTVSKCLHVFKMI